ncbi:MAG: hypothetical protein WCF85_19350 [Rhodospirillaceae bacterium]
MMTQDERRKIQDTLLRAAEAIIRKMHADAEAGNINELTREADKIAELTKQKDFPTQRSQEFQRNSKFIQREAYEKRVSDLLSEISVRLRKGDKDAKKNLLGTVRDQLSLAVRFGADEDFRASVDKRLHLIDETTKEGIDERAMAAARRKTELHTVVCRAPGGVERRRVNRYISPVLMIEIQGRKYPALNWSDWGMMIGNCDLPIPLGMIVTVTISCGEVPGGGHERARVVRRIPKRSELALEFPDLAHNVLALMHEMRMAGITPEPG